MAETWDYDERDLTIFTMEEGSPVFLFAVHENCDDETVPWEAIVAKTRLAATAPELYEALKVVTEFAAAAIEKLGLRDTNGIITASRAIQAKAVEQ